MKSVKQIQSELGVTGEASIHLEKVHEMHSVLDVMTDNIKEGKIENCKEDSFIFITRCLAGETIGKEKGQFSFETNIFGDYEKLRHLLYLTLKNSADPGFWLSAFQEASLMFLSENAIIIPMPPNVKTKKKKGGKNGK